MFDRPIKALRRITTLNIDRLRVPSDSSQSQALFLSHRNCVKVTRRLHIHLNCGGMEENSRHRTLSF